MAPVTPSAVPSTRPLRLLHVHLRSRIHYQTSLRLQDSLLALHWKYRSTTNTPPATPLPNTDDTPRTQPPPPILLTFSTNPVYTVGRRHLQRSPLSESQIAFLTRDGRAAAFHASSRGGLLTYHGPGQCTAYPIVDLRRFGLSARCYVRMLENAVVRTCDAFVGLGRAGRSETDPGVWMLNEGSGVSNRKVCALGVQVSRGVGCYGLGLNVRDEEIEGDSREALSFQDQLHATPSADASIESGRGHLSWGFGRIVACGLEGKRTTWLTQEGAPAATHVGNAADRLATELVTGLNQMGNGKETVEGVHTLEVGEREVEGLEEGALDIRELLRAEVDASRS